MNMRWGHRKSWKGEREWVKMYEILKKLKKSNGFFRCIFLFYKCSFVGMF